MLKSSLSIAVLFCITALSVNAKLELNPLFASNSVLQRNTPINIWGKSSSGAKVMINFADSQKEVTANRDGEWQVSFPQMQAGGPYRITAKSDGKSVLSDNIMIGDVWVCTGQSNMYWGMSKILDSKNEIKKAANPNLRLFTVKRHAADAPVDSVVGTWLPASPYTVGNFSAVGYFFGETLQQETKLPIGLIMSTVGGTLANNWTSLEVLRDNPDSSTYFERYDREKAAYPAAKAEYEIKVKTDPKTPKPRPPERRQPGGYYNGMIAPLHSFPVAGIIWYQGESDSWKHWHYDRFLHDMIADWRKQWDAPDMPFLIVQLAGFSGKKGVNENYPEVREIQRQIASEPNNGLAVTIDVGEADDIHPRNKRPVGERLAQTALAQVYGRDIPYQGPHPVSVERSGKEVIITLNSGAKKTIDKNGGTLEGFEVAGEDEVFHPASASLDGETITVSSSSVSSPVAVRYAWDGFPPTDLVNDAGLPASPFKESIQ
ncbi:sialate O-acetylesterase [Rubellicoccus peritrichatus]|uniref:Sialate O-acetylesterase n=1 Tax=Rubellicoccus peritrichatus TaxID=3080537 RepID=A0AAQ3LFQ0_9BACT|nr:sialate O-acetylesterase [Puniceicoccus sp. CR14]WOO41224.1 sialate O-acetylesterase [Puniceicoccus sp. CR14]